MNKSITEIILILILLVNAAISTAATVESIAATVEDRIIMTGDVITESKLLNIHESEYISLPIEGTFSMGLLDQMINRELVFREAMRSRFDSGERDVIDDMLHFEKKFINPEEFPLFLKEEGLILGDIVEWFHKKQITMAYINEKISLMSYVGALDVEEYYKENEESFEGLPIKAVENKIRALLVQKKGEVFLEKWIGDLRKRGNIKYFIIPQDQFPD